MRGNKRLRHGWFAVGRSSPTRRARGPNEGTARRRAGPDRWPGRHGSKCATGRRAMCASLLSQRPTLPAPPRIPVARHGESRSVPRRGDGDRRRGTAPPSHPSPHMLSRGPPPRCLCPASLRLHPRRLDRHLGRSRLLRQATHRLHADLTPVKKASTSGTRSTGIQTPRLTIPATTRGANDPGSNAHRSSRGTAPCRRRGRPHRRV